MSEKYFKNPYRGRKTSKVDVYKPEHKKLGLEPVEYPLKDPEEFERMSKKVAAEKKYNDNKKEIEQAAKVAVNRFRNGDITKKELEDTIRDLYHKEPTVEIAATETPVATAVPISGQSEDLQWTKGLAGDDEDAISVEESDDEEILADEVPDPPKGATSLTEGEKNRVLAGLSSEEASRETETEAETETEGGFGLDQVQVGEYVLLYKNSVLGTGSLASIKSTLANVMESEEDDDLSVEDFVVMKRVPVKMGIFIDD